MCLSCRHFGHFVLIRFFFWFFSYCWQVSVCDCVLPFEIISSVQHPDSNQWPHLFLSQQTHDFWALVLVHHTCPSVCHLSSLTSTFPSCSLLFAANALMSQSDSNSRVCVCFNVCTRLSFPSLAGFLSFPWWETRVPKELANVKSQSRLTENLLGNVCVCVCLCVRNNHLRSRRAACSSSVFPSNICSTSPMTSAPNLMLRYFLSVCFPAGKQSRSAHVLFQLSHSWQHIRI